jgi:two-component system cell cycle sensor histidine kinase/response regulator CckA
MTGKPTYEELEQRVKELEEKTGALKSRKESQIRISGIQMEWHPEKGTCTFENLPVAMMWVDTTLAGLMSGVQNMVGTQRFALALQSEGRKSVEQDWQVISKFPDFSEGFKAIANIAAVAGWGRWEMTSLDQEQRECRFRVEDNWEGRYQRSLGVCWGSGMLAGKMAGYCSKLFNTNCWADQTAFMAKGDACDEFVVRPSSRSIEKEIEGLLASDEATRADMAVALRKLETEITERKRAEEVLRESEEKFRTLVETTADRIWGTDAHARYIYTSPQVRDLFGYNPDEVIGRRPKDFWAPDQAERLAAEFARIGAARIPFFNVETVSLHKDGRRVVLETSGVPRFDSQENFLGYWGIERDITERKRVEKALRESEEKYRSILESIEEGYYEVDMSGNFTFFNNSVCEMMGYSKDELRGMNNRQYTDEKNARDVYRAFREVYETGKPTKGFDWEVIRKDGTKRSVEASVSLMRDPEGKPVGFRGIVRDVTNRKLAEEEKKGLEAQLQQARKMEAIGTLAGGIAHDFNNILMGIQGRASLVLLDTDPSDPHLEHLRGIEEYVKSAADLTKQLLGFARGGKYEVKATDLNELADQNARLFGRTRKEIAIHRKFQQGVWTVEVDRRQIEQVLLNLFVNAWQAMPAGGEIYLQTENVVLDEAYVKPHGVKAGPYVRISVTDNGVGMDEQTKERLFDPFFTTKEMGRGTGLGLASAYGIIKNHEGIITVYSEKGHGSTFNLYLPASGKEIPEEKKALGDLVKGEGTLLLVDDEEMILKVGPPMLEKIGYKVLVARSGKEAIQMYEKNREVIKAVILDMIMPQMSGGETFDQLRATNPRVKVLLSSGYSINSEAQEILNRGGHGFIQKPFSLRELSQRLGEILGRP